MKRFNVEFSLYSNGELQGFGNTDFSVTTINMKAIEEIKEAIARRANQEAGTNIFNSRSVQIVCWIELKE